MFRLFEIVFNLLLMALFLAFMLGMMHNGDKNQSPLATFGGFVKTSYVVGL
jgi:hypothetical protein